MVMERIHPPTCKAWMLRQGTVTSVESMSETGLYSLLFIDTSLPAEKQILTNSNMGTLMRTKGSHSNEGGVNTGFSVIDQPVLFLAADGKIDDKIPPNVENI